MKNVIMICAGLLLAAPAFAQDTAAPPPLPSLGSDTRAWLDLQTNPAAQTPDVRAVPGEVAEEVYQRYVNSFKHPIPEAFSRDSFVQGEGSGSK